MLVMGLNAWLKGMLTTAGEAEKHLPAAIYMLTQVFFTDNQQI